jgi:hypothetical protein
LKFQYLANKKSPFQGFLGVVEPGRQLFILLFILFGNNVLLNLIQKSEFMNWSYVGGFFDADGSITLERIHSNQERTMQISF